VREKELQLLVATRELDIQAKTHVGGVADGIDNTFDRFPDLA